MDKTQLFVIKSKEFIWKRKIRIDDEAVFYYFRERLANFLCEIENGFNEPGEYDCSIEKNSNTYSLTDSYGGNYYDLSLSECYVLVCMKYINIKNERDQIPAWAIHGGSFVYNNDLCLIIGSTHSGKSTTLYGLIGKRNDIKYINDDVTLFDTESLEIIPFCKPLQLRTIIPGSRFGNYYIDAFPREDINLSTISPPYLNFQDRIKYNKIIMFLLVRDNSKELKITPINALQKHLSLMFNCYNGSIEENRKRISRISGGVVGYQILFQDGIDVSQLVLSILFSA